MGFGCRNRLGLCVLLLQWSFLSCVVHAESPIRLSFLNQPDMVQDTLEHLKAAGCGDIALKGFHNLIKRQQLRLQIHPDVEARPDGADVFAFDVPAQLYAKGAPGYSGLVHWQTRPNHHALTCFDQALLLLREGPVFADQTMEHFATKHFRRLELFSKGGVKYFKSLTLELPGMASGENFLSPHANYSMLTGLESRSTNELNLALSLRVTRAMPAHYANTEMSLTQLFERKKEWWKRDGLVFSEKLKVVLCHFVDLRGKYIGVDHIGLLVPKESGWIYLEKNGTMNPIVRIDFDQLDHLVDFMALMFEEDRKDPRSPLHSAAFIISINDQLHRVILRKRPT